MLNIGLKFSIQFALWLMCNALDMTDNVMKSYDNKITFSFLIAFNEIYRSDCADNAIHLFRFLTVDKGMEISITHEQRTAFIKANVNSPLCIEIIIREPNFVVTSELTNNIAKTHNLEMLKIVLIHGGILDTFVLESACSIQYVTNLKLSEAYQTHYTLDNCYQKIKFILDNKIEPTQVAFCNIIMAASISKYCDMYAHKIMESILNLFIDYGYAPTYNDVISALKKNLILANIERYNIKFDMTYLQVCLDIGIRPPYKVNDLVPDLSCLVNECKKPCNLLAIKHIVTTTGLTPNASCIKEVCRYKNNLQSIKYLVSKGGCIDFECLVQCIETYNNQTLTYVLKEFKKNNISLLNTNLAKDIVIVDSKDSIDSIDSKDNNKKTLRDSDNKSDDSDNESDDLNMDINDDVSSRAHPHTDGACPANSTINNKIDDVEMVKSPINKFASKTPKIVTKIPVDFSYRTPIYDKISPALKKMLKFTSTHKNINYIDFRNLMLKYLNNNNLIIESNIALKSPFLYNGHNQVSLNEVNEWIYTLLLENSVKSDDGSINNCDISITTKDANHPYGPEKNITNESNTGLLPSTIHDIDMDNVFATEDNDKSSNADLTHQTRRVRKHNVSKVVIRKKYIKKI